MHLRKSQYRNYIITSYQVILLVSFKDKWLFSVGNILYAYELKEANFLSM